MASWPWPCHLTAVGRRGIRPSHFVGRSPARRDKPMPKIAQDAQASSGVKMGRERGRNYCSKERDVICERPLYQRPHGIADLLSCGASRDLYDICTLRTSCGKRRKGSVAARRTEARLTPSP